MTTHPSNDTTAEDYYDVWREDAAPIYPDVFEEHPVLTTTILCFLAVFTTLGTFGNVLVIGAVYVSKALRTPGNLFVINLALADVVISAFIDPMAVIGIVDGYRFFGDHHTKLCKVVGTICLWACISSILNIMTISINRYIALCHGHLYPKIFTWRNCTIISILVWVLSIAIEIPNQFGWGDNAYDMKAMICLYDRTHSYSYTVFFAVVAVLIPIGIVFVMYVLIFRHMHKSKQALKQHLLASNTDGKKKEKEEKRRAQEIRLAKTLFTIFVMFLVCWGPYAALVVLDFNYTAPKITHAVLIQMAHGNSGGINAAVYAVSNPKFRQGMEEFLYEMLLPRCLHPRNRSIKPSTTTGGESTVNSKIGNSRTHPIIFVIPQKMETTMT